jgi:hypothetical protein
MHARDRGSLSKCLCSHGGSNPGVLYSKLPRTQFTVRVSDVVCVEFPEVPVTVIV